MPRCRGGSRGGGPVVGKQHGVFKEREAISRTRAECTQERLKDVVRAPVSRGLSDWPAAWKFAFQSKGNTKPTKSVSEG